MNPIYTCCLILFSLATIRMFPFHVDCLKEPNTKCYGDLLTMESENILMMVDVWVPLDMDLKSDVQIIP